MKNKYSSPQLCYDVLKNLSIMEKSEEVVALSGDLELDMGE